MRNVKKIIIEKENLKELLLELKYLKHGGNGIIYQYNEFELVKLFYYNYFSSYNNNILDKVIEDIFEKIDLTKIRKILFSKHISNDEKILTLINRLNNTSSNTLYNGIIKVDDYLVATILNNYYGYNSYQDIYKKMGFNENCEILNKVIILLEELSEFGIYPTDIKLENIMINKNNLDVKLIDLDDNTTIITDKKDEYYRYQVARRLVNIRKKIINS